MSLLRFARDFSGSVISIDDAVKGTKYFCLDLDCKKSELLTHSPWLKPWGVSQLTKSESGLLDSKKISIKRESIIDVAQVSEILTKPQFLNERIVVDEIKILAEKRNFKFSVSHIEGNDLTGQYSHTPAAVDCVYMRIWSDRPYNVKYSRKDKSILVSDLGSGQSLVFKTASDAVNSIPSVVTSIKE